MAQLEESNTLEGSNKLPLLTQFSGKMEQWEDWSWSVNDTDH